MWVWTILEIRCLTLNKYDVCALGELLIDFTENGESRQGNPLMEANPGGAPCNVLAMLAKQGYKTAFIGKVGDDMFGKMLEDTLCDAGISTAGLVKDKNVNTTLAFVHTLKDGDREFSFYRKPGADMMLCENEVNMEIIKNSKVFHFGSLSMTNEICENATKAAIKTAEENKLLITFDPNLREKLWESLDKAKEKISYGLKHCDILKISDDEIQWFTGEKNFDRALEKLENEYHIPLVFLTLGKNGAYAYTKGKKVFCSGIKAHTTETTGAGDTFLGCITGKILEKGWREYPEDELKEMLMFACTAAGLITERKGALKVMPEMKEILSVMADNKTEHEKTAVTLKIYEAVKRIPKGKVASYGKIAEMAGDKKLARAVGNALHKNTDPENIPCYRVVNAKGELSAAYAFGGREAQKKLLEDDGIEVINGRVDLLKYSI